MYTYVLTGSSEHGTQLMVVINGNTHTISEEHPEFHNIKEILTMDLEDSYSGLFVDSQEAIESRLLELINAEKVILEKLTDDIFINGSTLYFRGEEMYDRLANTIVDFYREGREFRPLVKFMENLYENPSRHSRTQLFEFLNKHDFAITEEGNFIAYKGVANDFFSLTSGKETVLVNGESFIGRLPNIPGYELIMERTQVMDDPSVGCSYGLHVGTWEYARGFGPKVVEVIVNPAHVVSVPNDSNFQKVRTSQYQVIREVEVPVIPSNRYDIVEEFYDWLSNMASVYSRKGKVANSYEELSERFVDGWADEEHELTSDDLEALYSVVAELDFGHEAAAVYRYHIDEVVGGG